MLSLRYLILIILLGVRPAWSSEFFEYNRPLRALGMGGAYIPYVSPEDAPLVNPAALGFVNEIHWDIFGLNFGINGQDSLALIQDAQNISNVSDYNQFMGRRIWLNAYGRMAFVVPYFGMAVYNEAHGSFTMHNPAYPHLDVDFLNDFGLALAGAIPIGPVSSFGMTAKRINRVGGDNQIGLGLIADGDRQQIIDQFKDQGVGYSLDTAFMTQLPGPTSPRFAVVWQDIGDTKFNKTAGVNAPPKIENNLSVGVGSVIDLPGLDISTGLEVRHLLNTGYQMGQKIHLGTEFSLPLLDLRAGLSQGYPTYGVGFSFLFMDFNAAYYFTELGAYPGQTPENRVQLGLSLGLSVDADFKFYSKEGKKRKLKQRR